MDLRSGNLPSTRSPRRRPAPEPHRSDLDPGVEPDRYTKLQAPLLKGLEELGAKGGDDRGTLIRNLVSALPKPCGGHIATFSCSIRRQLAIRPLSPRLRAA